MDIVVGATVRGVRPSSEMLLMGHDGWRWYTGTAMRVDPQRQEEYRRAYEAWQEQLQALHRVLLDGERMDPPKLKGLLNREARAKARYDAARQALLGIGDEQGDSLASVG